ncbi:hypothetical protein [Paenibacillus abyssi]|uniref:Uncharacterized protein n=1 Tax=Paenibacillus abyssi TaxID=1340531 RepID=A0A917D1M3_9BACL|nr:hypothetical protein [Paenibacillus abyssi]GGG07703.1 hypothetical protein GCM10010916_25750 [Paenibacillus abyssi]
MRIEEYQINLLLKKVSAEEEAMLKNVIHKQFGVSVGLTPKELSEMKLEVLTPLLNMLRGLVLTKQHKPDIRGAHYSLQSKSLPRKVVFGRVDNMDSQE